MLNYTKLQKLLIVIIISFALVSCENNKVELTQEEYKRLIGDITKPQYPKHLIIGNLNKNRSEFLIELGSDGHDYAHNINAGYDAYVCFHYPDCVKCKNRVYYPFYNKVDTLIK